MEVKLKMDFPENCESCRLNYDSFCCCVTGTKFYDGNEAHFDPFKDRLPDCPVSPMDKRDIPARVTVTTSTKRCPSCKKQVSGRGNIHPNFRYCRWCGKALDWTEE